MKRPNTPKTNRNALRFQAETTYVHRNLEEAVTNVLNRVYEKEDAALDSGLARLQSASLPKEQW